MQDRWGEQMLRCWGRRLRLLIAAMTVVAAVAIVLVMRLLLQGEVTGDCVLTGFVTAALVAPITLALFSRLSNDISRFEFCTP